MLKLHHIGSLVDNIADALDLYGRIFPEAKASPRYEISSQGVAVCFLEIENETSIEFVEPVGENSSVKKLKEKGFGFYHLGFLAKDFDAAVALLESLGFLHTGTFESEAFEGRRCAFLMSSDKHLVELIEE